MSDLTMFWALDDEQEEDTKPMRLSFFNVKLIEQPLFYTVTYVFVADVDGLQFLRSQEFGTKPSNEELHEWARSIILMHQNALKVLNVAVEETYERFGGSRFDLIYTL